MTNLTLPTNHFKAAIKAGKTQIGLWGGLGSQYATEISAGAGFDWLLIDTEHTASTPRDVMMHLQICAAYPTTHPIVRVTHAFGEAGAALIKQHLDIGAQTILAPMIDTPEQAAYVVGSMRYTPRGWRGVGGARSNRWGRIANYQQLAEEQLCTLVQCESQTSLNNLEAICAVDGVDGVFIGPADLSASLGYIGQLQHPEVLKAIDDAIGRINKAGKASGILTADEKLAQHYIDIGCTFVAVGLDNNLLVKGTNALVAKFKPT